MSDYTPSLEEVAGRAARDFADQFHFNRGAGDDAAAYEEDYQRYKAGAFRMIESVRQKERERCARMPIQMPRVERVEVIDNTGRAFVAYYEPGIEVHVQDDGRTLKIFAGLRSSK